MRHQFRISQLELLDEMEELELVLAHYAITWGVKVSGARTVDWGTWALRPSGAER